MEENTTAAAYRLIPLRGKYGKGKSAKVDPEDFEFLSGFTWRANHNGYPIRSVWSITYFMHRDLLRPDKGTRVDHINGDPLDNRRCNLRICSHAENMRNRRICRKNLSGFKGVAPSKYPGRWQAKVGAQGKAYNCGTYDSQEAAARAYDSAAVYLHGKFARTNFPDATPLSPEALREASPRRRIPKKRK